MTSDIFPMRWLAYFILAYVALGAQIGLAPYLALAGAIPNLVLLCAIFLAINAGREPALLGCFGLGAMQDMLSQQPLGLFAFSYCLVGMFVVSTQELVYREHPLTHFSMALSGGFITAVVLILHDWLRPASTAVQRDGIILPTIRPAWITLFTSAIYTAALAILILGLLQRIKKIFAFDAARRKART